MSNDEIWAISVDVATREFNGLDPQLISMLTGIVREIMALKEEISSIFDGLDGVEICRLCRGECCQTGCYHFTAVDLIAYLVNGRPLFSPSFDNGSCPFLGEGGCMMPPSYRPYNCVTFVCDRVDEGMDPVVRERFAALSSELRDLYQKVESLFANRFLYGILNNGRRFVEGRSAGILRSGDGNN